MSVTLDAMLADSLAERESLGACERNAVADAVSVWLVGYRAAHGISPRALAARVGIEQAAIARLEAGDVEPRLSTLLRLAGALGTAVDLQLDLAGATTAVTVCTRAAA